MMLLLPDGRTLPVDKSVLSVGADPACDVVLTSADVKPSHALLLREGEVLTVVQAPSGGRIRVNGRRVECAALEEGDVLQVGRAELLLQRAPSPAPVGRAHTADAEAGVVRGLAGFAARLLARRPPRELLAQALLGVVEATASDLGYVVVEEPQGRRVLARAGAHAEASPPPAIVADSLVERAFASGAPVLVSSIGDDAALAAAPSVLSLRLGSAIAVPLKLSRGPTAVLYLGRQRESPSFTATDADAATALAALAALLLSASEELLQLSSAVANLSGRLQGATYEGMVGESPAMREVYRRIDRLGPTSLNVLIRGETGTGKELVARALHRRSARRGRFVPVSCAALPETLAERELFGNARGAFSGATSDREGLFEAADGGTLFLDELGELTPSLQTRLLRVLQEREVTRLGETRARKVDVRVLAATHVDLEAKVAQGAFRADLLFRLDEVDIRVPPLRERGEDVLLIAHDVLRTEGGRTRGFTHRAEEILRGHPFPGNVRQLVSAVRRAALMAQGEFIDGEALGLGPNDAPLLPLEAARDAFVRGYVREAIARAGGNKRKAAESLGIGLRSIFRHLGEEES